MDDGQRMRLEPGGCARPFASPHSTMTAVDVAGRQRLIRLTLRAAAVSTLRSPRNPALVEQLVARACGLAESLEGDAASIQDPAIARYAQQSARHFYTELATLTARIAQSG